MNAKRFLEIEAVLEQNPVTVFEFIKYDHDFYKFLDAKLPKDLNTVTLSDGDDDE